MKDGYDRTLSTMTAELQALFAAMDDLVLIRDAVGRCQKILTPHSPLLFLPAEQIIGHTLHDNLPPSVADHLLSGIQAALQQQKTTQREYELPVGDRLLWLDARISPVDQHTVMFVIRDVSDHKQLEVNLSKSQQQLQTILDQANAAIVNFQLHPLNNRLEYLYYSAGCERIYGYTAAELQADSTLWQRCVHPDDWQQIFLPIFSSLQAGVREIEYRFYHRTNAWHWIAESATVSWNDTQQCWSVILVANNVSDRKRLEAEREATLGTLREKEERLRLTLDLNQIGCWEWETSTGAVTWDDQFARLLGLPTATPPSYDRWRQCVHPADIARAEQALAVIRSEPKDFQNEYRVIHPDGSIHWLAGKGAALQDETGTVQFIGIAVDVSDRKVAEMNLHSLNEELNRRVQVRTRELQKAQIVLKQREQHLRNLLETIPDVVAQFDRHLRHVYINAAVSKVTGLAPATFTGKQLTETSLPQEFCVSLHRQLQHTLISKQAIITCLAYPTAGGDRHYQTKLVPEIGETGEVETVLVISRDITDLKTTELALRQSEEQFRTFFDAAPMPLSLANIHTRQFIRVNTAFQTWLGYSHDELQRKTFLDITYVGDIDGDRRLSQAMQLNTLSRIDCRKRFVQKSGEIVWADIYVTVIRDPQGQPLYSLCLSQDVTQSVKLIVAREQAEAALLSQVRRAQLLRSITQHIHQSLDLDEILAIAVTEVRQTLNADRTLIVRLHPNGFGSVLKASVVPGIPSIEADTWVPIPVSQECYDLFYQGITQVIIDLPEDTCTFRSLAYLQQADVQSKMIAPIIQIQEQGNNQLWGLLIVHACITHRQWQPDEADLLQQMASQLAIAIQQATLYQQAQVDLAKRQQTEHNLRVLLREKEVLLKEVHHRVKNNLQIISSLLRMQSRLVDGCTANLFQEAQNRVQSIAIIHEHLYQSGDISHIDFEEYVQILVNHLMRSYGVDPAQIRLCLDLEPIELGLNTAIPCGLIINELVSNSLKYAFFNTKMGEIKICLYYQLERNSLAQNGGVLIVEDNGVGFPADLNWKSSRSLGLRIVCTLVEQIGGSISLHRDRGTAFRISFPLPQIPSHSTR